jgi:predicted nucleic acid-binding protein
VVLGTAIAGRRGAIATGDEDLLDLVARREVAIISPTSSVGGASG